MRANQSFTDRILADIDHGLRTCFARPTPVRSSPSARCAETDDLAAATRKESIRLMRVNHAGEISAQALYRGQAFAASSDSTRAHLRLAAQEEQDHLCWCAERIEELGGRPSMLAPFWYAGSFAIGVAAAFAGDAMNLGFIEETERQVEAHLDDHLSRLAPEDLRSRAILEEMAVDEARHRQDAAAAGATPIPRICRSLMTLGGGILRQIARIL
jgi:ubiquinone biosynthesis monooxygenase Coq7